MSEHTLLLGVKMEELQSRYYDILNKQAGASLPIEELVYFPPTHQPSMHPTHTTVCTHMHAAHNSLFFFFCFFFLFLFC
jgi:hypothetical protein